MNYAFGHGLSYTKFELGEASLSTKELNADGTVTVTVPVSNIGSREGAEVIQVYVRDVKSSVARPMKELKAFQKVTLKPGQTSVVKLTLDKNAFAYYNADKKQWEVEPGKFEILVGTASDKISARLPLNITASDLAWKD